MAKLKPFSSAFIAEQLSMRSALGMLYSPARELQLLFLFGDNPCTRGNNLKLKTRGLIEHDRHLIGAVEMFTRGMSHDNDAT